jgi:hypothetical protein
VSLVLKGMFDIFQLHIHPLQHHPNINMGENGAFLRFIVKTDKRKIHVSNDIIGVHHVILTNYEQALLIGC